MTLHDILKQENVNADDHLITSKKQLLEKISNLACKAYEEVNYVEILQALLQRERIGCTSVGHGVAIPHARVPDLNEPFCCLITLHTAINFSNEKPNAIDVFFGLLVPEEATDAHLELLSDISSKLQDKTYRDSLREAKTDCLSPLKCNHVF